MQPKARLVIIILPIIGLFLAFALAAQPVAPAAVNGPEPTATAHRLNLPLISRYGPWPTPVICPIRFLDPAQLVAGGTFVQVTGDYNSGNDFSNLPYNIRLLDLTSGTPLADGVQMVNGGGNFECPGFRHIELEEGLTFELGHLIMVQSPDGTFDVGTVAAP